MCKTIKLSKQQIEGLILINNDIEEIKDRIIDREKINEINLNIPQPINAWVNSQKTHYNPKNSINPKKRNNIDIIDNLEENDLNLRPSTCIPAKKGMENRLKQKLSQNAVKNSKMIENIIGNKKESEIKQRTKENPPSNKKVKMNKIHNRATTHGGKKIINIPFVSSLDPEFLSLFAPN